MNIPSAKQFLTGALIVIGTLWLLHVTKLEGKLLPPMSDAPPV